MKNPFDGAPAPRLERKEQKNLGALWKPYQILNGGPLAAINRSVPVSPRDIRALEEYDRTVPEQFQEKENNYLAETLLCEAADGEGRSGKGFNWFEGNAFAYPSSRYDDVLRGADAMLVFLDPEKERHGYPVAVDVTTTTPESYEAKLYRDATTFLEGGNLNYFVDTRVSDEDFADGVRSFDNLEEGSVPVLNVSAYVPSDTLRKLVDQGGIRTGSERLGRALGYFVRRQIAAELEAFAVMLVEEGTHALNESRTEAFRPKTLRTRDELIDRLVDEVGDEDLPRAETIFYALQDIYLADAADARRMAKDPSLKQDIVGLSNQLPDSVKAWQTMWNEMKKEDAKK